MFKSLQGKFTPRSLPLVVFTAVLLQGCASTVIKPVTESDKDTSGTYNGTWQGVAISTASKQSGSDNWVLNCSSMAGEKVGRLLVEDGLAQMYSFGGSHQAFVDGDGRFRFEVPMKDVARETAGSDISLSRGAMTYILYGSLENLQGTMTFGIAEFSNNGCSSKVEFKKL